MRKSTSTGQTSPFPRTEVPARKYERDLLADKPSRYAAQVLGLKRPGVNTVGLGQNGAPAAVAGSPVRDLHHLFRSEILRGADCYSCAYSLARILNIPFDLPVDDTPRQLGSLDFMKHRIALSATPALRAKDFENYRFEKKVPDRIDEILLAVDALIEQYPAALAKIRLLGANPGAGLETLAGIPAGELADVRACLDRLMQGASVLPQDVMELNRAPAALIAERAEHDERYERMQDALGKLTHELLDMAALQKSTNLESPCIDLYREVVDQIDRIDASDGAPARLFAIRDAVDMLFEQGKKRSSEETSGGLLEMRQMLDALKIKYPSEQPGLETVQRSTEAFCKQIGPALAEVRRLETTPRHALIELHEAKASDYPAGSNERRMLELNLEGMLLDLDILKEPLLNVVQGDENAELAAHRTSAEELWSALSIGRNHARRVYGMDVPENMLAGRHSRMFADHADGLAALRNFLNSAASQTLAGYRQELSKRFIQFTLSEWRKTEPDSETRRAAHIRQAPLQLVEDLQTNTAENMLVFKQALALLDGVKRHETFPLIRLRNILSRLRCGGDASLQAEKDLCERVLAQIGKLGANSGNRVELIQLLRRTCEARLADLPADRTAMQRKNLDRIETFLQKETTAQGHVDARETMLLALSIRLGELKGAKKKAVGLLQAALTFGQATARGAGEAHRAQAEAGSVRRQAELGKQEQLAILAATLGAVEEMGSRENQDKVLGMLRDALSNDTLLRRVNKKQMLILFAQALPGFHSAKSGQSVDPQRQACALLKEFTSKDKVTPSDRAEIFTVALNAFRRLHNAPANILPDGFGNAPVRKQSGEFAAASALGSLGTAAPAAGIEALLQQIQTRRSTVQILARYLAEFFSEEVGYSGLSVGELEHAKDFVSDLPYWESLMLLLPALDRQEQEPIIDQFLKAGGSSLWPAPFVKTLIAAPFTSAIDEDVLKDAIGGARSPLLDASIEAFLQNHIGVGAGAGDLPKASANDLLARFRAWLSARALPISGIAGGFGGIAEKLRKQVHAFREDEAIHSRLQALVGMERFFVGMERGEDGNLYWPGRITEVPEQHRLQHLSELRNDLVLRLREGPVWQELNTAVQPEMEKNLRGFLQELPAPKAVDPDRSGAVGFSGIDQAMLKDMASLLAGQAITRLGDAVLPDAEPQKGLFLRKLYGALRFTDAFGREGQDFKSRAFPCYRALRDLLADEKAIKDPQWRLKLKQNLSTFEQSLTPAQRSEFGRS